MNASFIFGCTMERRNVTRARGRVRGLKGIYVPIIPQTFCWHNDPVKDAE
jgi:hypothetical protein